MALQTQPTATVTTRATVRQINGTRYGPPDERLLIDVSELIFTETSWLKLHPSSLYVFKDNVQNGLILFEIVLVTESSDDAYNGLELARFNLLVEDEDVAKVVTRPEVVVIYQGYDSKFTVALGSKPSTGTIVNIEVISRHPSVVDVLVGELVFTPDDYHIAQYVTVNSPQSVTTEMSVELELRVFSDDDFYNRLELPLMGVTLYPPAGSTTVNIDTNNLDLSGSDTCFNGTRSWSICVHNADFSSVAPVLQIQIHEIILQNLMPFPAGLQSFDIHTMSSMADLQGNIDDGSVDLENVGFTIWIHLETNISESEIM
ncbi:hypothetical protein BSKO_14006 [Bryopsis sp. KO-2023]|nr:hypothetical protein BSKO_14006 [Bryopsis sp. KO-2023]